MHVKVKEIYLVPGSTPDTVNMTLSLINERTCITHLDQNEQDRLVGKYFREMFEKFSAIKQF